MVGGLPTGENMEAFPVAEPAAGGFVDAAVKDKAIAIFIFQNPRFCMEEFRHGAGLTLGVTGNRNLDL